MQVTFTPPAPEFILRGRDKPARLNRTLIGVVVHDPSNPGAGAAFTIGAPWVSVVDAAGVVLTTITEGVQFFVKLIPAQLPNAKTRTWRQRSTSVGIVTFDSVRVSVLNLPTGPG